MSRLKDLYNQKIVKEFVKSGDYSNIMAAPKITKICVNSGTGEMRNDKELEKIIFNHLAAITGQMPTKTLARKAISNFKIRKGDKIGVKLTLRNKLMYNFLDRLINIALPRIRDFRGLSEKGFDGCGNYTLGFKEQVVFPEINIDKTEKFFGLEVVIVTSAKTDEEAKKLLTTFGMPFKKIN